jgi:hypothetical protein
VSHAPTCALPRAACAVLLLPVTGRCAVAPAPLRRRGVQAPVRARLRARAAALGRALWGTAARAQHASPHCGRRSTPRPGAPAPAAAACRAHGGERVLLSTARVEPPATAHRAPAWGGRLLARIRPRRRRRSGGARRAAPCAALADGAARGWLGSAVRRAEIRRALARARWPAAGWPGRLRLRGTAARTRRTRCGTRRRTRRVFWRRLLLPTCVRARGQLRKRAARGSPAPLREDSSPLGWRRSGLVIWRQQLIRRGAAGRGGLFK